MSAGDDKHAEGDPTVAPPSEGAAPGPAAATDARGPRSAEGRLAETSNLATAGLVAGVLGSTAAVFGLAIWAIDPGASALTITNLIFAVGALLFYVLTNRSQLARMASGRSTPLVLLEVVLALGVIAAAVVANVFAARSAVEWDLTHDQLFTLTPQSIQLAEKLEQDVVVVGFLKPVDPQRTTLTRLVELYQRHTKRIRLEFVNPDSATPAIVERYKMSPSSPRIVVAIDEQRQTKIARPEEEALTNALVRIAERPARKVYFLGGHGESSPSNEKDDGGMKQAAQDLIDEGYEVAELSLLETENLPADASVLVVAGPKKALFPHEVQTIGSWLKRGGRALLMIEVGTEPGLEQLLRPWGIDVGNDLIVDPNPASKALGFGPDAPVITKFEVHPITDPLAGQALLFYWARSVQPKLGVARTEHATLVMSSPTSWGETRYAEGGDVERDEADVPGPVPIAVAASRRTVGTARAATDEARLVVIGDASFATNRFVSMSGNGDLFVNAVSWLAGEESRIAIRPKSKGASRIPLTESQQFGIVFFSVNLMPLLIMGIGFSVWAVRRRK
jgi:ABC-type uncharacterized transport system involved in gliding motility auxiliary subunit